MNLAFERPWLLLLLALPVAHVLMSGGSIRVHGAPWGWAPRWSNRWARCAWHAPRWFTGLAVVALVLAAARPVTEREGELPPEASVAVMIALDVSPSMRDGVNAPLTQASATLERFLGRETGFRFGLVTFAGSALTRLPPTTDPRLLSATLGTAAAGVSDDGTAIGTAIGLAGARLRSTEAHGRAVILLTDGLHNAGAVDPVTAAAIAREDGATVHAIVLEGAPVEGRRLLREIVTAGGGRLVESSSAEEALEAALAELVPVRGEAGPPERRAAWGGLLFGAVVLLLMGEAVRTLRPGVER